MWSLTSSRPWASLKNLFVTRLNQVVIRAATRIRLGTSLRISAVDPQLRPPAATFWRSVRRAYATNAFDDKTCCVQEIKEFLLDVSRNCHLLAATWLVRWLNSSRLDLWPGKLENWDVPRKVKRLQIQVGKIVIWWQRTQDCIYLIPRMRRNSAISLFKEISRLLPGQANSGGLP